MRWQRRHLILPLLRPAALAGAAPGYNQFSGGTTLPRTRKPLAASVALAVLAWGVSPVAYGAPAADDKDKKEEPKKDEPKKEEKKEPLIPGLDIDLEELLKQLPPGAIDPEQIKQMQQEIRKMMEEMRKQFPGGLPNNFPGGLGMRFNRMDSRFGARLEKPSE